MFKFSVFIYSILGCFTCLQAQVQLPDGTYGTLDYIQEIKKNYTDENSINFSIDNTDISAKLSIRVHIILDINGKFGFIK